MKSPHAIVNIYRLSRRRKPLFLLLVLLFLGVTFPVLLVTPHQQQEYSHQAAPASAATPFSTYGHIYWKVDYETGDLSQWQAVDTSGGTIGIVTHPVHTGKYAAKFTLKGGNGGEVRVETTATQEQTGGYEGQAWYYSWSMYIPAVPNQTTGWADWNLITQWMDLLYQCSPPLQIDIKPLSNGLRYTLNSILMDNKHGCKSLGPSQQWDLGPVHYDQWVDFTVHIKWSTEPAVGFAQVWINGRNVLPLTHMRTLDNGGGVYMQQDIYRPSLAGTNVIYFDDLYRHDAYNPSGRTPTSTPAPISLRDSKRTKYPLKLAERKKCVRASAPDCSSA